MGLLGEIYSAGDSAKRKLKGLLSDPLGELGLLGARAAEDMQTFLDTGAKAYPMLDPRLKPRLDTPQGREMVVDQNAARRQFGDMAGNMGMAAATVWHGSPHLFQPEPGYPLGRFRADKIGSGEGAQAYGMGHYTADAKEVGADYARNLANRDASNQMRLNAHANAQRLANLAGDAKFAADDIRFALDNTPDHPQKQLLTDTLNLLESGAYKKPLESSGHLYKVDLPDEAIAKMLDWDKPLSQQPKEAQQPLREMWLKAKKSFSGIDPNANPTASQIHHLYQQHRGGNSAVIADELLQAGIPGIRYLDGGSRGAGTGTRNYVVFPGNEGLLTILERNGVAP